MRFIRWMLVVSGVFVFFQNSMGQMNSKKYDLLWKKVDDLVLNKGLPKSALVEVDKIYEMAKKEKEEGQLLKALVYGINLRETGTENAGVAAIVALEKEWVGARGVAKAILGSVLAQGYWSFFQNNRWKFYNRTAIAVTASAEKGDMETWGVNDFHARITELYLGSLSEEKLLKETKLSVYDAIINKGTASRLRPTLFDLLANRALEYFMNDEKELTRPAYAFEINQAAAFDPAADFFSRRFVTRDSLSMQHKALLLYQQLIAFHLYDTSPDALIDIDLKRLQYVRSKAVMENKEELYYMAIKHVAEQYQRTPAAAQAWYLVAQWHAAKAAKYHPVRDTANRYENNIAEKICEEVLLQKDESEGRVHCINLLKQIRLKQLTLLTEKVNMPAQPFRSLVSYKNISKVYLRVVRLDDALKSRLLHSYDEKYWQQLTDLAPLKSWEQSLPDTKDHQQHAAEIRIDALPVGTYMILAGTDQAFAREGNALAVQFIYVSAISFINSDNKYFALHRETGKPLAGASVQVWNNYYDYNIRKLNTSRAEKLTADNNGYFSVKEIKDRNSIKIEIDFGLDHLLMDDQIYSTFSNDLTVDTIAEKNEKENTSLFRLNNTLVFLFTDRAIYRPGQTIYFKGIAISKDFVTGKSKILAGKKTMLLLENANNETVDSLMLTTNEFGSYAGSFRLPENTLNGEFTLRDEYIPGEQRFSVEEYKRPRFYVEYEKLKGTYKVNDSISISGLAKAYAGNNIDGAAIKYRVVRVPRFIYPWLWGRRVRPATAEMEITNGEAVTDGEGRFTIRFKAIPDASIDRVLEPVFDYKIVADITDNNGETRSGETMVSVSYKALLLKINIPPGSALPADSLRSVSISTRNTNGEFEPALVALTIYPLQQPRRLIRARLWEQPDQFVVDAKEYAGLFPHDEYDDEKNKENWARGTAIVVKPDTSRADGQFTIMHKGFLPGWYLLEASTTDKYGSQVKDVQYIRLYDPADKRLPVPEYITSSIDKSTVEPGEKASITLGTTANDLTIIEWMQREPVTTSGSRIGGDFKLLKLDNETRAFDYGVSEADRGGISVAYLLVKDNRFYALNNTIAVPWTNKELNISYETFRDKTLSGSEEKWKLKISGSKKEKVAAEMLVSMYDASLDQFKPHDWNIPGIWPVNVFYSTWNGNANFQGVRSRGRFWDKNSNQPFNKSYDQLNILLAGERNYMVKSLRASAPAAAMETQDVVLQYDGEAEEAKFSKIIVRGSYTVSGLTDPLYVIDGVISEQGNKLNPSDIESMEVMANERAVALYGARAANGVVLITTKSGAAQKEPEPEVKLRKNFNETAFFLPDLHTDEKGDISFSFTMPEALTRWKFQGLAYTKELAFGYTTSNLVTQKELMVQPNVPRFIREGDRMRLSTKIVNLSPGEVTGTIELQLLDAATLKPVDGIFQNMNAVQYFTADAGKSTAADFTLEVPYRYNSALVYRFIARTKADSVGTTFSDGEEASLPVLTNSMLVTESMPLPVRGNAEKKFSFTGLLKSGNSETLQHHALTVEFTLNPAWNAVQALPYLMEYPYECAEQTFNRFYANALASMIANSSPRLKRVFEKWKTADTAALVSNLEKNAELKSVLLEETPWVLEAKSESQQKKNIALLFDMVKMEKELNNQLEKLVQMQSPNGGFVWFKGGPDDRYITQYILTGIGHLNKLHALPAFAVAKINKLVKSALPYLDARIKEDYDLLLKSKADIIKNQVGYTQIQFLYMRSFYPEYGIPASSLKATTYYRSQSQKFWVQQIPYMQGMTALHLFRTGDKQTAAAILKSLKEKAVVNEETGMYWKDNKPGYFWHQAPVETHSLLIEAFHEISKDPKTTGDLKTWLLKQKQTRDWRTTKATADACYALLLQGSDWLSEEPEVTIRLGNETINSEKTDKEEGTGYFKTIIAQQQIKPSMGDISVQLRSKTTTPDAAPAWGAVYWQYFEKLDKITPSATPLQLTKKLFIERNTDRGPVLEPVREGQLIKAGDKIKVRIELKADRDMEYVHMKDMRASCMEPVNVLSGYKWQGGLGYYETTRDAATHFFFDRLFKGTYVFEYPLFATVAGNFSNGITTIQCMYAPEFASHSEGIRVNVE